MTRKGHWGMTVDEKIPSCFSYAMLAALGPILLSLATGMPINEGPRLSRRHGNKDCAVLVGR